MFKGYCIYDKPPPKHINQQTKGKRLAAGATQAHRPFVKRCVYTEHYSAVRADVELLGFDNIPSDPTTMLNDGLINALQIGSDILLAGEALDFCLANTVRDIADKFSVDEVKKLVLLEDATSAVNAPGIEHFAQDFIDEMTAKGMRISTTDKYFN